MNYITSPNNNTVKEVKQLKERRYREEKGLFFIEGSRFVEEAVKENITLNKLFISEKFASDADNEDLIHRASSKSHDTFVLTDKLFKEISDTGNPQGILAVISVKQYLLHDVLNDNSFIILLDAIQDPGNMGTIIRTADAAGVTAIIASKGSVDIYNPKVLRSTMGSVFRIPVVHSENIESAIAEIKKHGIKIYAAHLDGETDYFNIDYPSNSAFIIGNEANGISDSVASCADMLVKIPMPGKAESLNASIAAALLMYEVIRQRNMKL